MPRSIKFRAWDGKEMLFEFGNANGLNEFLETGNNGLYKFMQFTGFFDKNGKEIYEGDIIQSKMGYHEIWWNAKRGSWGTSNSISTHKYKLTDSLHHCEVVGNLYEKINGRSGKQLLNYEGMLKNQNDITQGTQVK